MNDMTKTDKTCRSKRPRYFHDQLLTAGLMTAEQDFHHQQRWQLNRSLLGSGVVHGLTLEKAGADGKPGCLHIGPGLAIDCWGRVLEIGEAGEVVCYEDIRCPGQSAPKPGRYTLLAHYAERAWPFADDPHCPPHKQQSSWYCSGVRFSLAPECEPSDPCACPDVDGCLDACAYICRRQGSVSGEVSPDPNLEHAMACPPPLCDRPDGWRWDPKSGVALGCVEVRAPYGKDGDDKRSYDQDPYDGDHCDDTSYWLCPTDDDPCGVRRHVYRNRQLFELIQECHLERPRLEPPSWLPDWDGIGLCSISWSDFATECNRPGGGFPIRFTRLIDIEGVHRASIILKAVTWERRTDYWEARRVPLADIVYVDVIEDGGRPYLRGLRLKPTDDWLKAEINGSRSTLFDGALIELVLRGQMLRDPCGTLLDARPPGAAEGPEHVRNGDDLVIAFRVEPRAGGAGGGDSKDGGYSDNGDDR